MLPYSSSPLAHAHVLLLWVQVRDMFSSLRLDVVDQIKDELSGFMDELAEWEGDDTPGSQSPLSSATGYDNDEAIDVRIAASKLNWSADVQTIGMDDDGWRSCES